MLMTSLDEIKSFDPCQEGWKKILKGQGKTCSDGVLFPVSAALESNSIQDVCWLLQKKQEKAKLAKFARLCAASVEHLQNDVAYAVYAANAADAACAATNAAGAYAARAADRAADATYVAAVYAAANAAYGAQMERNKQFLKSVCIEG